MFRTDTVQSVALNICFLINTIQAPGNASPQLLLSILETKMTMTECCECFWIVALLTSDETVSWFREDLSI